MASEITELQTHHYQQQAQPSTSSSNLDNGSSLSSSSLVQSTTSPTKTFIHGGHYSMLINNNFDGLLEEFSSAELINLVVCETDNTMLHLAASISQLDFMDRIIRQCPQLLGHPNYMDDLPIHFAAKASQFEAVDRLVFWANHYQDSLMFERVNNENNTALHIALENQQLEMAKILFSTFPKSFYLLNKQGISPLYLAIKAEFWDLVRDMLSENVVREYYEAEEKFKEGNKSVVHAVIIAKKKDILEMLLDVYGGLIYNTDELGRKPLSYAAYTGFLDGVHFILDKFPNQAFKMDDDQNGSFPMHSACKGGHLKVVKALFSRLDEKARLLLNKKGQTILHVAAANGKVEVVEFILGHRELETMINTKDADGNTPLHLAAFGKHPRVVYNLTWDKRVKLGLQNKNGLTALDIAEDYEDQPPSFQERLTWLSLKNAGVPRAPQLHYLNIIDPADIASIIPSNENSPIDNPNITTNTIVLDQQVILSNLTKNHPNKKKRKNKYKERINTLIVVAALVATVTFASGFTVPGGYNNNNPDEGLATLAHKVAFQVFVISDTISMHSAILSLVTLIWAHLDDPRLVLVSFNLALPLLGTALAAMAVAFTAAMYVVLHTKVFWLGVLVLLMGCLFLAALFVFFAPLYSPTSCIRNKCWRYVCHPSFKVMLFVSEKGKERTTL